MARWRTNKNLGTDFSWVLWGSIFYSACQWGIVLVLAKLGSPRQVGEYALGMAVTAPILVFANFQLRALLASDVGDQFAFREYFKFRAVSLTAALLMIVGISAGARQSREQGLIILLVGLAQTLDLVSEMYYGWMQKCGRMDRLSRSLTIKGPLALAALASVMYLTGSLAWALVGLAAGRLVVLLSWDARFDRAGSTRAIAANPKSMLPLLRLALPLGVISMLGALNSSIPRWFLEAYRGSSDLGMFSAIASLLSIGGLIISAFGQAIFVPVAKACQTFDRAKFRGFLLLSVAAGGVLGGVGVLAAATFGRAILSRLLRPEYGEHADLFVRLMIAGTVAFVASGVGYVITAARSLRPQIPVLAASVIAAIGTAAWFIPRHGLLGAADAMLVAAVVQLSGTLVVAGRIDRRLGEAPIPKPIEDLSVVNAGIEA